MLKTLLRVRMAALLAAFTGQSRKRKSQTKGKAAGGSRPTKGSSMMMSFGSWMRAEIMASFCFMPCE